MTLTATMRAALEAGIARVAAALARAPWEAEAISRLLRRSANLGWGAFDCAGVWLARVFGVSRRQADRLIHRLEELGYLSMDYRGDRLTPRRVRLTLLPAQVVDVEKLRAARASVERSKVLSRGRAQFYRCLPPPMKRLPENLRLTDDPTPCRPQAELGEDPLSGLLGDIPWPESVEPPDPDWQGVEFEPPPARRPLRKLGDAWERLLEETAR